MLPGALMMLVAGPFSGVLVRRFGGKLPLALGALISAALPRWASTTAPRPR